MYLLIKRDLYWRPNARGYTGLKSDAGRYTLVDAQKYSNSGVTMLHEDEAADISRGCFQDIADKWRAEEITRLRAENKKLQEAVA